MVIRRVNGAISKGCKNDVSIRNKEQNGDMDLSQIFHSKEKGATDFHL